MIPTAPPELETRNFKLATVLLFVVVLGRVEAEDFLPLAGARVNGAEVFAALHLPDGRDLPVLLDGVVGDLLGRDLGLRGLGLRSLSLRRFGLRGRRFL